jgi:hypothetical protein
MMCYSKVGQVSRGIQNIALYFFALESMLASCATSLFQLVCSCFVKRASRVRPGRRQGGSAEAKAMPALCTARRKIPSRRHGAPSTVRPGLGIACRGRCPNDRGHLGSCTAQWGHSGAGRMPVWTSVLLSSNECERCGGPTTHTGAMAREALGGAHSQPHGHMWVYSTRYLMQKSPTLLGSGSQLLFAPRQCIAVIDGLLQDCHGWVHFPHNRLVVVKQLSNSRSVCTTGPSISLICSSCFASPLSSTILTTTFLCCKLWHVGSSASLPTCCRCPSACAGRSSGKRSVMMMFVLALIVRIASYNRPQPCQARLNLSNNDENIRSARDPPPYSSMGHSDITGVVRMMDITESFKSARGQAKTMPAAFPCLALPLGRRRGASGDYAPCCKSIEL